MILGNYPCYTKEIFLTDLRWVSYSHLEIRKLLLAEQNHLA
jgi:hypothetical protein